MPDTALGSADTNSCRRKESQSFSPKRRQADSLQSKAKATETQQWCFCTALMPAISSATYFPSSLSKVTCSAHESVPQQLSRENSRLPCLSFVWLLKLAPAFQEEPTEVALSNKQSPAGAETFPSAARPRLRQQHPPACALQVMQPCTGQTESEPWAREWKHVLSKPEKEVH